MIAIELYEPDYNLLFVNATINVRLILVLYNFNVLNPLCQI